MGWKEEAERLKFDEGKSWGEVSDRIASYFPQLDKRQVFEKVRSYLRKSPKYNQIKSDDFHRSSLEYKSDGTIISEKFIMIRDGEEMTPDYLIEAHGLKPSAWEVVSYKNNFWNSQIKGGHKQISYQSKITVKPKAKGLDLAEIDKHFLKLDRTYKPGEILPATQTGNLIAEVNISDLHLGRLCWWGDTGNNYDYKIARDIFNRIISNVCHELKGKPIEYITFPIGNDLVNSDTPDKTTTAGTPQDTDVRWQKLIDVLLEMEINAIDMLKKIAPVKAFYVSSNHDETTTYAIVTALKAWYRDDPRVTIDKSPMQRKYFLYGVTLVGYSHGSNEKPQKGTKDKPSGLAALVPVEARTLWAQAKYVEVHAAHFHTEQVCEEINGVIVRRISSPTAPDTWTYESGYIGAVRKAQTFLYDKERGLMQIINTPV